MRFNEGRVRLSPQVPPLLREGPEPLRKTWLYSMEVGVSCGVWTTPGQYHPRLVQYTGVQATRVDNGQHLVPLARDIMFVVDDLLKATTS